MSAIVLAYHQLGHDCLEALHGAGVEVAAVFTHEDDSEENCWFDSVAGLARRVGFPVHSPENINDTDWVQYITGLKPDVLFSLHYRQLVSPSILSIPKHGCVNLHASLLPRYRGRCPINWQLVHGETVSGMTLHHMTQQADAGDIIDIETVEVSLDDRAIDLYRKLLPASERVLLRNLSGILTGNAPRYPQDPGLATTFPGRKPEDGRIDCTRTAVEIHNLVRAVAPPWPGAFCDLPAGRLVIQRARVVDTVSLAPGELIEIDGTWYLGMARGGLELLASEIVPSASVEVRNETSSPVRNVDS